MNKPLQAALFDLDGTLLDTAEDFVVVLETLSARHSIEAPEPELIRNNVSAGARALVALLFDIPQDDPRCEPLRLELLDIYDEVLGQQTVLFPGMQSGLSQLEELGVPWGIVTNKPRRFAEPLVTNFGFRPRPGVLVCPEDVSQSKPHPESLLMAAKVLNAEAQHCIYVGDHARDIEAGKRAGMTTIAAAYGYIAERNEARRWGADIVVDHADEIAKVLTRLYM